MSDIGEYELAVLLTAMRDRGTVALQAGGNGSAEDLLEALGIIDQLRMRARSREGLIAKLEERVAALTPPLSYREYLETPDWAARRATALAAAGNACQVCNARPHSVVIEEYVNDRPADRALSRSRLHVHHRTYERFGNEDPSDLTVLCEACHEAFHQRRRLWRPPVNDDE